MKLLGEGVPPVKAACWGRLGVRVLGDKGLGKEAARPVHGSDEKLL